MYVTQNSPGVPGGSEVGDRFGSTLQTGRFDSGEPWDLVVGAYGEDSGSTLNAGDVVVFKGTSATQAGYQSTGARGLSQNTTGIPDTAEGMTGSVAESRRPGRVIRETGSCTIPRTGGGESTGAPFGRCSGWCNRATAIRDSGSAECFRLGLLELRLAENALVTEFREPGDFLSGAFFLCCDALYVAANRRLLL